MQGPGRGRPGNQEIFDLAAGNWAQISEGLTGQRKQAVLLAQGLSQAQQGTITGRKI